MDKKEILQFEIDDASKMGINGKQVFFTKRINGKTTHNKLEDKESLNLKEKSEKQDKNEELFIEFKNPHFQEDNIPEKKKSHETNKKQVKRKKKKTKAQKRREKKKRIIRIAIIILIIVAVIIFALISPIFNITNIEAKGNEKIDSNTIISLSGIQQGNNIFKISKNDIEKKVKENPYINSVSIKRKLPGTVEISVEEREISYQVKVINSYVYIDYQGYILEVASKGGKVPQVEGFVTEQDTLLNGKRLSNDDIEKLKTLLKIKETATSAGIWGKISKISIKDNQYILEIKKENKIAYLGNATDLTNRMMFLKVILDEEKGNKGKIFIDGNFSNGFKPYFREEKK